MFYLMISIISCVKFLTTANGRVWTIANGRVFKSFTFVVKCQHNTSFIHITIILHYYMTAVNE